MIRVNVKKARSSLSSILDHVERGEEVIITRRGKEVARMLPPTIETTLPSLKRFRASIRTKGQALSQAVKELRQLERY